MRYLLATLLSPALVAAFPSAAAHANPDHSEPADGAQLTTPPTAVKLLFSRAKEPSFSKAHVVNTKGEHVDDGKLTMSDNEHKLIQLELTPLPAGKYTGIWRIVALDGHMAKGEFSFTLN